MTKDDYRAALAALGLSQVAAAKVLGIADRTSRAYALGERPVPEPVALALRLLMEKQRQKRRVRERRQQQWRGLVSADTRRHPVRRSADGALDPVSPRSGNTKLTQE